MHFLVVDFEATCCDKNSVRREEMEIIEFGAVMVEAEKLAIVSEFQSFVKPVRKPILTQFCKELTTISQTDVDKADRFHDVLARFLEWSQPYEPVQFCSWGLYDNKQLQQDCRYHRQSEPFAEHLNLKQMFTDRNSLKRRYGMADAVGLVGLKLQGTHHRGIDDARNIASLLPYIVGDLRVKPGRE